MPRLRSLISAVLVVSLLAPLLHGPHITRANSVRVTATTVEETGLQFRLSHGIEQPDVIPATKPAAASDLSQTEIEEIVKRLPPMTVDPSSGIKEFSMRERSIPPPRTGNTIETSFPAGPTAAIAPSTNAGPLAVLRYSPEGSVPLAPDLTVTFSQPMVPLTSQEEAATNVPVKLTPQPPGKWRWLGTQTLTFQPEIRFPMATTYTVTVPAGTRAANGGTLATEKSWSFTTSPLTVKTSYPAKDSTQPRDSLMFIEFDQRIDPASVLRSIRVTGGNRILKTRLATSDEVKQAMAQDWNATAALREAAKDRSIAFRAITQTGSPNLALPSAARIQVSVVSGAASAEGPNTTAKPSSFDFNTYGPLRVTEHGCNGESGCSPYDEFGIEFSNELSEVDHSKIRVEPALAEMEIASYGSTVSIDGLKRGDTTYRVTFDKSFKDKFNQTLGRDLTLTFRVGPNARRFVGPPNDFVVMDPASPTRCSVFSINFTQLNVRLYSVTPNDWPQWAEYQRDVKPRPSIPGRLVFSKAIPVRNAPNNIVETVI
ncbi:MAG TPA: Ig-like domain-containing protein, partial [Pyrinomonadaceae bacterium]|nr:Ig-like domain-containing protein [Pyrinomonadaceae bacterium]